MRTLLVVTLATAACGLNIGVAPARRVFPNPPSLGALADAPEYDAAAPRPSCNLDMRSFSVQGVDVETSAPWGASIGSDRMGIYLPDADLLARMQRRVSSALAECPGAPGIGASAGPHYLRFVIEHVESDTYDDDGGLALARVTLRVERYDDEFAGVSTVRVDGVLRSSNRRVSNPDLLLAALDRAVAAAFQESVALAAIGGKP